MRSANCTATTILGWLIHFADFFLCRAIPEKGNRSEIVLTALHHNVVGIDKFLGRSVIPLKDLDVYEQPKNRWYALESKAGKKTNKIRSNLF